MASLENVQGLNNSQDVNLGNMSSSNDPLQIGADALARGRQAGFSDEETLGVLSRRRRHQRPVRMDNREVAQAQQRFATVDGMTPEPGRTSGGESAFKGRTLRNSEVQFELDGGERDQSAQDAYYGRDENEFSRYNKDTGEFQDVYIRDGLTTPDDLRDQAILRSWGIGKRKTGQEEVVDRRGHAVINQQGEVIMRNTYDYENTNETTAGQGWEGGGGRAAADAVERLDGKVTGSPASRRAVIQRLKDAGTLSGYSEDQIDALAARELADRRRRVFGEGPFRASPEKIRDNNVRTGNPAAAVAQEKREAQKAVILSGMNFGSRMEHDDAYYEETRGRTKSVNLANAEYLPGALTKYNVDPDTGITISTNTGAEPDAIFGARPQAVIRNEEAVEVARSLGDDVSAYVDIGTGEGVEGITPSRLQTNLPNTSQQVNAPVTTAASWVASNLKDGKTGDLLGDTNMSQITADFSRRVEAAAPGYRSRPVRTVEGFSDQIGRVLEARQAQGKPFYEPAFGEDGNPIYTKGGRQKQNKVANPGIPDVLRLLRMTSGEQGQLANALYTMQTSTTGARPTSSFSPGVQVNTGSMYGEKLDLGVAGRDTQRAAFARANDEDAQKPQIGAIRERDEFGGVTREEPPLKRAVMKGRTPDEAVATYKAQRAKNNQPVDEVYAEKIRRENASLRADQRKLDEDRAVARATEGGKRWDAPRAEAEEDDRIKYRGVQKSEANERQEIIKLIKKGATTGSESGFGRLSPQDAERASTFGTGGMEYHNEKTGEWVKGRYGGSVSPGRKLEATWSKTPVQVKDGTEATAPIRWPAPTGAEPKFSGLHPAAGGNGVKPPDGPNVAAAGAPMPDDMRRELIGLPGPANDALKRGIAARVDQQRQSRRRKIGGGAAAAGGLAAVVAALTGGQREEQYQ